jgi:exonuclease I
MKNNTAPINWEIRARLNAALEPLMVVSGGYAVWYHLSKTAVRSSFHPEIAANALSLRLAPFIEIADVLAECEP